MIDSAPVLERSKWFSLVVTWSFPVVQLKSNARKKLDINVLISLTSIFQVVIDLRIAPHSESYYAQHDVGKRFEFSLS